MTVNVVLDINRMPESMTTKDAAMYLGSSQQTVRNYIKKGYLPTIKLGAKYMVTRAALKKMLGLD